jgi:3-dehydroquinate synthase II
MADRVCIDTTSLFRPGEGLLLGSTARSFALVHAETLQSEFIATRPFRVNAGAVHSYLFTQGGVDASGTTRYLSELAAGQSVQAIHPDGAHRILGIGRVKVERRPHLLVRWRTEDGTAGNATLQNAETIRLVSPDGTAIAVTELRPGAHILVHNESAARHTGLAIDGDVEER